MAFLIASTAYVAGSIVVRIESHPGRLEITLHSKRKEGTPQSLLLTGSPRNRPVLYAVIEK